MARLEIDIVGNLESLDKSLSQSQERLQRFGDRARSIGLALTATVTAAIAGIGVASIKTFGDLEALKKGLIAVMGSAEEAEKEFKKLIQVAKLPGLGLQEATRGSVALQSAGFSADQARESLLAFGNALATVGKGKNELNFVILALTQLQNKTTGFGQDLRQLTEQLPQLRGALTDAFGTAESEAIADLGVTGREVVEAITKEFAKLPKVTGGIKNAFENLSDSTSISFARIGESINNAFGVESLIDKVASAFDSLSKTFSELDGSTQVLIISMAGITAAIGPLLLAIGGIISALPLITAGFAALISPIGLIAAAVAIAIPLLVSLNSELKRTSQIAGLVKADLLAESLKTSREEFERLSASLEKGGLKPLEAQNRAIDLLLKQELELLKARKTNKDIDFDAIKARVAALNKLKEEINGVKTATEGLNQTFEEFSKLADIKNEEVFAKWAQEADNFNAVIAESQRLIDGIESASLKIASEDEKDTSINGFPNIELPPIDISTFEESISKAEQAILDAKLNLAMLAKEMKEDFMYALEGISLNFIVDAITEGAFAIGQALAEGTNVMQAFGKTLLNAVGSFLRQLGKEMVAYGTAALAMAVLTQALSNPYTAIPAAIGLIAAGAALSLAAGAIQGTLKRGANGSGGGGNVSTGAASESFTGSGVDAFGFGNMQLTSVIKGTDILLSLERTQNKNNKG